MNITEYATIVTTPDTGGFGTVSVGGQTRLCYFDPTIFVSIYAPAVGARVLVTDGGATLAAYAVIGIGAPA